MNDDEAIVIGRGSAAAHPASAYAIPNYASTFMTTNEVVDSISSLKNIGMSA